MCAPCGTPRQLLAHLSSGRVIQHCQDGDAGEDGGEDEEDDGDGEGEAEGSGRVKGVSKDGPCATAGVSFRVGSADRCWKGGVGIRRVSSPPMGSEVLADGAVRCGGRFGPRRLAPSEARVGSPEQDSLCVWSGPEWPDAASERIAWLAARGAARGAVVEWCCGRYAHDSL